MEALLFLLALVPIALLILMIRLISKISDLSRDLQLMREQLAERGPGPASLQDAPAATKPVPGPPPIVTPPPAAPPPPPPVQEEASTVERMRELFPSDAPVPRSSEVFEQPVEQRAARPSAVVIEPPLVIPPGPPPPPRPSFFERHPDLEKFIGENLINKIGIAVLVLGLGLLMQYAIGKDMISETGQILIGLASGGLLVFFAHRLRKSFRAFSSVLVAGGVVVFYFSIAIAFHKYQLIGQTAAFAIMVAITGLAVLLTLAYDRKELAVIALLGGFAAPFLVSTGEGNFRVLFTYLLILDVGMLVLANFKKWHIINVLSFLLTALIFGAWAVVTYPGMDPRPSLLGFAFASAFFVVFFGMNLRYNLRHKQAFGALDHTLLLVNTAAYYAAGMHLLSDLTARVTGLFTVLLGLFYLVFAVYFNKMEGVPRTLKLLLIGLVLTFISLAVPVQLEGNHITLFWAAEAVLLLWFAQRTGIRLIERASVLVAGLMGLSLWMDLSTIYGWGAAETMRPLLNKGWITGMAAAASFGGMTVMLRRRDPAHEILPGLSARSLSQVTATVGVVLLYLINFLELRYQLGHLFDPQVVALALMAYSLLFVLALDRATRSAASLFRVAVNLLLVICGVIYITGFYMNSRYALWLVLNARGGEGFGPFHYIAFALMVVGVVRIALLAREHIARSSSAWNAYLWAMCAFVVVFASQELDHAMLLLRTNTSTVEAGLSDARRVGYPILWGIGSFLFMWYGMRQRMRMVRVIALCLFAITLVKLFLFDLGELSEGGRVAAFIFLGALLLVISFMYQKLKVLLQDDAPNSGTTNDARTN
ncbi:MAG: DUF2339 domain-containing protein [Flavobacteriales bacterium]|nr:DUF2339 domain-containing protein [Flavobacteriales bacterium]